MLHQHNMNFSMFKFLCYFSYYFSLSFSLVEEFWVEYFSNYQIQALIFQEPFIFIKNLNLYFLKLAFFEVIFDI